jgi:hypothetical protein
MDKDGGSAVRDFINLFLPPRHSDGLAKPWHANPSASRCFLPCHALCRDQLIIRPQSAATTPPTISATPTNGMRNARPAPTTISPRPAANGFMGRRALADCEDSWAVRASSRMIADADSASWSRLSGSASRISRAVSSASRSISSSLFCCAAFILISKLAKSSHPVLSAQSICSGSVALLGFTPACYLPKFKKLNGP